MRHYILIISAAFLLSAFVIPRAFESSKIKCMVQLKNYNGEGAYIAISVVGSDGKYIETLKMLGDDEEWYPDLTSWWSFFEAKGKPKVDGITGATIAGGERSIFVLDINDEWLDAGNSLRFETAVENQDYHETDLEISLTKENFKGSFEGSGYIRYVRLIPNK